MMVADDIARELGEDDVRRLLVFMMEAAICGAANDLKTAVLRALNAFVPHRIALCGIAKVSDTVNTIQFLNVNCPDDFFEIYTRKNYFGQDPLIRENCSHYQFQYWSDTYRKYQPPKNLKDLLNKFGIKSGYTIGTIDEKTGTGSILSIGTDILEYNEQIERVLKFIIPSLHKAMQQIRELYPRPADIALTPKEMTVLNWLKLGKSSWEIARILGITERTVNFHVYNIIEKLNVATRIQAVVAAIQYGLIDGE